VINMGRFNGTGLDANPPPKLCRSGNPDRHQINPGTLNPGGNPRHPLRQPAPNRLIIHPKAPCFQGRRHNQQRQQPGPDDRARLTGFPPAQPVRQGPPAASSRTCKHGPGSISGAQMDESPAHSLCQGVSNTPQRPEGPPLTKRWGPLPVPVSFAFHPHRVGPYNHTARSARTVPSLTGTALILNNQQTGQNWRNFPAPGHQGDRRR